jgi:Na+/H+ antiporter NhaD/arsenite permease-like protein
MNDLQASPGLDKFVLLGIGILVATYLAALFFGLPQVGTSMIVAAQREHAQTAAEPAKAERPNDDKITQPPPLWTVAPFALMLGVIAVFPLVPRISHWWESNLSRFCVAAALGALVLGYFLLVHSEPVEADWPAHHIAQPSLSGPSWQLAGAVFANAVLGTYVPFIVLLFSLYVISGGIHLEGDLPAHPVTNSLFLLLGGVLASFIGTTGAAMVLIRPVLSTNSERKYVVHTLIFFIFIVCNCGGCLLPLGDPPLFLGYLLGVPFLYTLSLWKEWLFINGLLIVIYYLWDRFWCYPLEEKADILRDETQVRPLKLSGVWPNAPLFLGVVLGVALLDPSKAVPGTDWHPWLYLREVALLILVGVSLATGSRSARAKNDFSYHAIIEVAALFIGIFITMQPALQILSINGTSIRLTKPWHFFWTTGGLSSVLDNAPTYVVFFTAAQGVTAKFGLGAPVAGVSAPLLAAISLGAVFMGANTYIGNGPNFMVKAIAERSGVEMPSFFRYLLYSGAVLIPLFIITTYLFL